MTTGSHIIVTGGAGFIGSHACKALARRGFVPVTYEKYRPAAVMHFAALAYVGESVEKPALYHSNNVDGSTALLQALLDYRPLPFVFSSTCATYGVPEKLPIAEDHPQRPINPYGQTKLTVERMLADMGRTQKLPWIALRYFNAAGADPDGEIGEVHDPETHLIPLVLMAARNRTAVKIFGTDYDTPDGTCIRDYVHVTDIADAHLRALDHLLAGGDSMPLNLANARGYSVREVITACERVCGRTISCEVAPRRDGDPAILVGLADQARTLLGWAPQRSAIEVQIADAWRWLAARG